ncbi:MAG: aspartate--tRNA ligase [Hydrogeniiclostridium mannosilyticum]
MENSNVKEDTRLKYRYLDLRRPDMQQRMIARHRIVKSARDYFDHHGFLKLRRRTSLNPRRRAPGLPGAKPRISGEILCPAPVPQQFKQLLMLSGFDRYVQFARCFRDEDLRADRQPEFTQIDLEMSFVDEDDVMEIGEGFLKHVFKEVLGVEVETPFQRMTWHEGMERFGSDKPDLRFGMELTDLSGALRGTAFRVFASALEKGSVRGINFKGGADRMTRKEIDKLAEWVKDYGAKGLAWTRLASTGESSSYEKFLSEEERAAVRTAMGAEPGDLLFLVASEKNSVVFASLGALRCELAARYNLIDRSKYCFLWITDFPLFEFSEEENRWVAMHHPFTAPREEDVGRLLSDPGSVCARAYDVVLNGYELGGGSIRINDAELQERCLRRSALPGGGTAALWLLYRRLPLAPPHGGMAAGLDRLVMLDDGYR